MRRLASLLGLIALGLPARPVEAGAWTRAEGTSYAKVSAKALIGDQAFVSGRDTVALPASYQSFELSLYGEYGITDEVTAVLQATPVGVVRYDRETDPYIGDVIAALRYRLALDPVAVSIEVHAGGRPAQSQPTGAATVDGRTFVVTPLVGTLLGGAQLAVGRGFGRLWLTGHAGARFHSEETLEPALYAFLQVGWHVLDALTAALHVTWWHSLGDLEPINVLGTGQTRYLGYGLGLTWWTTARVGLFAGIDGAVYASSNAATPALAVGLELR